MNTHKNKHSIRNVIFTPLLSPSAATQVKSQTQTRIFALSSYYTTHYTLFLSLMHIMLCYTFHPPFLSTYQLMKSNLIIIFSYIWVNISHAHTTKKVSMHIWSSSTCYVSVYVLIFRQKPTSNEKEKKSCKLFLSFFCITFFILLLVLLIILCNDFMINFVIKHKDQKMFSFLFFTLFFDMHKLLLFAVFFSLSTVSSCYVRCMCTLFVLLYYYCCLYLPLAYFLFLALTVILLKKVKM